MKVIYDSKADIYTVSFDCEVYIKANGHEDAKNKFLACMEEAFNNALYNNTNIDEAISHFKYGISHDIFSEKVARYAKLAIAALEQYKEK